MIATVGTAPRCPRWTVLTVELTAATVFPILLGSALILGSLLVAVRSVRVTDRSGTLVGAVAVLGALGVTASLVGSLDRPGSVAAFALGAVGATVCYAAVYPRNGESTVAAGSVALLSVLWISGSLAVGATAGGGRGHYALAGVFGALAAGVALACRWRGDGGRRQYWWLVLSAAFLCPAAVGVIFGEEVLFVTYLIAAVVGTVLWWFDRLDTT